MTELRIRADEVQRGDAIHYPDTGLIVVVTQVVIHRDHDVVALDLLWSDNAMTTACAFGCGAMLPVMRPDFDPVIEHYRAVFADYCKEAGL